MAKGAVKTNYGKPFLVVRMADMEKPKWRETLNEVFSALGFVVFLVAVLYGVPYLAPMVRSYVAGWFR